jgi:excisionase family DNA binding protein
MIERGKMETQILKVNDVAKKMNTSGSWIYKKCKAEVMPHVRIGGTIRFVEKDIEAWINAHKVKGCLKV